MRDNRVEMKRKQKCVDLYICILQPAVCLSVSLEVEVDDDIIEELSVLEAGQVLCCHGDASFRRGWRVLDQLVGQLLADQQI